MSVQYILQRIAEVIDLRESILLGLFLCGCISAVYPPPPHRLRAHTRRELLAFNRGLFSKYFVSSRSIVAGAFCRVPTINKAM